MRMALGGYRVICRRGVGQFKYLNTSMPCLTVWGGLLRNGQKRVRMYSLDGRNVKIRCDARFKPSGLR